MRSRTRRVVAVSLASLLAAGLAELAHLPAGALLGSMLVSIAASLTLSVHAPLPRGGLLVAQSVLGGALCSSFTPEAWSALADNWAVSLAAVVGVVAVAQGVALVCARLGHLDPRTATLGLMPGGASAMVALSDELGADARLVTLFQYVRLCIVILVAVAVGRWAGDTPEVAVARAADLPGSPSPLWAWLTTAAVSAVGGVLGHYLKLPAGAFLGPVLSGIPLTALGLPVGAWPPGVLALALWALGVRVGSQFDASAVRELKRVAHVALAASVAMVVGCLLLAWGWSAAAGVDLITTYFATSPGGADSVLAIALGTRATLSVVLAVQVGRVLLIFLVAPTLLRRLSPSRDA
ncbi:AbrB family transcriptional regulator [Corallococcus macrosporus]|uniref:AbrB family transcriptional regulator n=1 Tax=Corallococcus macrosporus TaxID=35 RepID=UPI0005BA4BE8|nr:AbrB family transcriptional regulator [Corallococcus macrosporus]